MSTAVVYGMRAGGDGGQLYRGLRAGVVLHGAAASIFTAASPHPRRPRQATRAGSHHGRIEEQGAAPPSTRHPKYPLLACRTRSPHQSPLAQLQTATLAAAFTSTDAVCGTSAAILRPTSAHPSKLLHLARHIINPPIAPLPHILSLVASICPSDTSPTHTHNMMSSRLSRAVGCRQLHSPTTQILTS
jgi:hypothetical protein